MILCRGGREGQDAARQEGTDVFIEAGSASAIDAGDQPERNTLGQGVQTVISALLLRSSCQDGGLAAAAHCSPLLPSLCCLGVCLGVIWAARCARVNPHPAPGHTRMESPTSSLLPGCICECHGPYLKG